MADEKETVDESTTQTASDRTPRATPTSDKAPPPRDELGRFFAEHGMDDEGESEPAAGEGKDDDGTDDEVDPAKPKKPDAKKTAKDDEDDSQEETQLTDRQKRACRDLGYSDDEMAGLTPTEVRGIEEAAKRLSRKMSELGRAKAPAKDPIDDGSGGDLHGETGEEDRPPARIDPQTLESLDFEITEDDVYSGDLVPKLNAVLGHFKAAREEAMSAERDKYFLSLSTGENPVAPEFGDKPMSAYDDDAPEAALRNQLWLEAKATKAGFASIGKRITDREALERAFDHYGREQLDKAAERKVKNKMASRRRQAVPTAASSRRPAEGQTADDKFNRAIDDWERKHDIEVPEKV
mgnify:CR=1 FL=1